MVTEITALSILGFIGGIIIGVSLNNFGLCILEWVGIFLYVIIYFGIGMILKNQEMILGIINTDKTMNNSTPLSEKQADKKSITQIETEETIIDVNQLSDEHIEQIQQYLSKDEKYHAAKRLCDITGIPLNQAIDAINNYVADKDVI